MSEERRQPRRTRQQAKVERLVGEAQLMQEHAERSNLPTEVLVAAYEARVEAARADLPEPAMIERIVAAALMALPKDHSVQELDELPEEKVLRTLQRQLKRGGLTSVKYEVLNELRNELRGKRIVE